jgi:cbb3-type cytochrome oxidase maturation protein
MSTFTSWMTQLADDGLGGVLVILLPLGVLGAIGACVALAWAVRSQQFDNLDVEAQRILFEDRPQRDTTQMDAQPAGPARAEAVADVQRLSGTLRTAPE